jgi:hypothetical protein
MINSTDQHQIVSGNHPVNFQRSASRDSASSQANKHGHLQGFSCRDNPVQPMRGSFDPNGKCMEGNLVDIPASEFRQIVPLRKSTRSKCRN